ncbi:hypothetical protein [Neptunitalea lumnitzerae]|uniref:Uncharacterized protein n=1 Tax=Neptunitalea lumnitzerae TaxID=2965509 RepID=A0ABQ5MFK5_9FLAO|nr:hypothetical protein [Neptunitalea sp. Y10]GLB48201.1 hypothetical protein Y10_05690 [Neptunitalea sp. Y10]
MINNKKILISILLNSLILIGAGYGLGILVLLDFISINIFLKEDFNFHLDETYDSRLIATGLIAFLGKLILLLSMLMTNFYLKNG